MNDSDAESEPMFASGPPVSTRTQNNVSSRRLSDPGLPSERLAAKVHTARRQSDPGRDFTFALRRETLRPGTRSMNPERRSSYADTSSATQSFVSFDTAMESTPMNNSAAGFATASDGEGSHGVPQYGRNTARSNTVYAPRAAGQQHLDPRRAATMDPHPRLGQRQSYHSGSSQDNDYDDSVLAAVLGDGDPNRDSFVPHVYDEPVPDVVLDTAERRAEIPNPWDDGDRTVRRPGPDTFSQRRDTRETVGSYSTTSNPMSNQATYRSNDSSQRQPLYHPLSAQEAHVPPGFDPQRSHKVSATSTVVPDRFPPSGAPFQESPDRERIPSAATISQRPAESGSRLPSTAAADSRQQAPTTYPQPGSSPSPSAAYGRTPQSQYNAPASHPSPGRAGSSPSVPPAQTQAQSTLYPPARTGTGTGPVASSQPGPVPTPTAYPPAGRTAAGAPPPGRAESTIPSRPTGAPSPQQNANAYPPPGRTGSAAVQPSPGQPASSRLTPTGATTAPASSQTNAYAPPGRTGSGAPPPSRPTGSTAPPPSSSPAQSQPRPAPQQPTNINTTYPPRPTPLPNKPTLPPTRQDQHTPQTPTTVRPSNASNRPLIPAKQETPKPPRKVPPVTVQRPPLPAHASQMNTRYVNMLLAIDDIPSVYNLLASFFTWILLAGFVLFPGTFTSLRSNSQLEAIGVDADDVVKHVSLFVIAWVCTGIGAAGMIYLWIKWRRNYIWCNDRIFVPGLMNSLAGVLSTISSVLGTQNATLSISSKSTLIVTVTITGICGILTAFYMFVLIRGLKNEHVRKVGKQHAGKRGEGYAERETRKGGYVNMLLALDSIPSYYNLFANFFTWILLAGFVLFPGTFTNLQQNKQLSAVEAVAVDTIKHVSLFVVAWVCTGLGAAGMLVLWYRWSGNYIWCSNRIFLPGLMNSLAGVLSAISSIFGTQSATLSISSKSTLIVTSATAGICGILTALYMFVLIRGMKNRYEREMGGKHG